MHLHWLCVTAVKQILNVCWFTPQTLLIPCSIRNDVIHSIPSRKFGLLSRSFSPPVLFPFSRVVVDLLAGKFSLCDIRVLPSDRHWMLSVGICLLSCWLHKCRRDLGLVMQIMTLCLPRRHRLGWDQLQINSAQSLTPCQGCLLPAVGAVKPYLLSAFERGRAAAGNANFPGGEIPVPTAVAGKWKGLALSAWLSYSRLSFASLLQSRRHGNS